MPLSLSYKMETSDFGMGDFRWIFDGLRFLMIGRLDVFGRVAALSARIFILRLSSMGLVGDDVVKFGETIWGDSDRDGVLSIFFVSVWRFRKI